MRIVCNGTAQELPSGATVAELLAQLRLGGPVAVEVNFDVVPRDQHARHVLHEQDEVEIVTLVGGG